MRRGRSRFVERVTLAEEGLGIEAQARKARYAAFAGALRTGEALVTAQHPDDQCETFLLALKRGSGPAGLSAMPERSEFAGTTLLRPLLGETRASLEARRENISSAGLKMRATGMTAMTVTFCVCAFSRY